MSRHFANYQKRRQQNVGRRHVTVPANIDFEALYTGARAELIWCHKEDLIYLVGLLYERCAKVCGRKVSTLAPLDSRLLQKKIPSYKEVLLFLVRQGILEGDFYYTRGRARRFCLASAHMNVGTKPYTLTVKRLLGEHKPPRITEEDECNPCKRAHERHLKRWNRQLTLDRTAATQKVESEKGKRKPRSIQTMKAQIEAMEKEARTFRRKEKSRRIFTNFTGMMQCLREFLRIQGSTLVGWDLKNAQLCVSTLLFNERFYDEHWRHGMKRICPYVWKQLKAVGKIEKLKKVIRQVKDEEKAWKERWRIESNRGRTEDHDFSEGITGIKKTDSTGKEISDSLKGRQLKEEEDQHPIENRMKETKNVSMEGCGYLNEAFIEGNPQDLMSGVDGRRGALKYEAHKGTGSVGRRRTGDRRGYNMLRESPEPTVAQEFAQFTDMSFSGNVVSEVTLAIKCWLRVVSPDWESIAEHFGFQLDDRQLLKRQVLSALFSGNQFHSVTERGVVSQKGFVKVVLGELYPNVYHLWAIIKRNPRKRPSYQPSHKNLLAYLLQAIEAHFVIDVVAKRITEERPEMPLFPLHDALYTTPEHADYLREILLEESKRLFGAPMTLSATPKQR